MDGAAYLHPAPQSRDDALAACCSTPLVKMVLDLDVSGLERRQVTRLEVMSFFAACRLEPGLVLPIHVNPEDPSDFVLVW
jgi:hypothetical protein